MCIRREIEHQSLAPQHSLAHGASAVPLSRSRSRGRFFHAVDQSPTLPASLRPRALSNAPASRIPAGSERVTGLPKGHEQRHRRSFRTTPPHHLSGECRSHVQPTLHYSHPSHSGKMTASGVHRRAIPPGGSRRSANWHAAKPCCSRPWPIPSEAAASTS
jgi:hypothetical protein